MFRTIQVQFEPIDRWPVAPTANRRRSPFRAKLSDTYQLLERELLHLGCRRLVIQADCDRRMIRNDGLMRADARLRGPGVILAFDSKHGPLRYPCDTYQHWDCNLRAIALALEALRAVDRYGVTRRAEQYRGWQALASPTASPGDEIRTRADALAFLRRILGDRAAVLPAAEAIREAARETHPDRTGGAADNFKRVMRCEQVLRETA